jgi:hypothetical protein
VIWVIVAMVASFGAGVAFVGCLATLPKGWTLGVAVRSVVDEFDAWWASLFTPPTYAEWLSILDLDDWGVDYYDRGAPPGPVQHWPTEFPPGTIFGSGESFAMSIKGDPTDWLTGTYDSTVVGMIQEGYEFTGFTPLPGEGER